MSRFVLGNLFLLLSMGAAAGGHMLVKKVMDEVKSTGVGMETIRQLLAPERLLRGGTGGALIVVAFLFWMAALTKLDLSYAYPVACSSVLLVVLFSALFLGEPVTARTWLAAALIVTGVVLLAPTK